MKSFVLSVRGFKKIAIGVGIFIIIALVFIHGAMNYFHYSNEDISTYFETDSILIEKISFQNREVRIIVEELEKEDSLLVVFVHGAPGSWDAFKEYMKDPLFQKRGRLVTYDRPGYNGDPPMPDIDDQTDVLVEIINKYKLAEVCVIGHSYGATIAGNIACRNSSLVNKSIMIAPLLDPYSEPIFWYSYLVYWRVTKWMAPQAFQIAGDEKFAHAKSLERIEDNWKKCCVPIIHIHGTEDALAPFDENTHFSTKEIPSDCLELLVEKEAGHLLLWTEYEKTRNLILERL